MSHEWAVCDQREEYKKNRINDFYDIVILRTSSFKRHGGLEPADDAVGNACIRDECHAVHVF